MILFGRLGSYSHCVSYEQVQTQNVIQVRLGELCVRQAFVYNYNINLSNRSG